MSELNTIVLVLRVLAFWTALEAVCFFWEGGGGKVNRR